MRRPRARGSSARIGHQRASRSTRTRGRGPGSADRRLAACWARSPPRTASAGRAGYSPAREYSMPQQVRQRGHAAHRRTGGRRAALLLQGDRRRQAVDRIHLAAPPTVEQPPRVGRDGFEIPALGLGVQRAERQRRLARTRNAGEDDQRVAGDVHVDVLQVVRARAPNADDVTHGGSKDSTAIGLVSAAALDAYAFQGSLPVARRLWAFAIVH